MAQVIDCSAGFPGAANIRDAGFAGAVRYIGFPDRRKCATAGELADFRRRGIGMALVFQDGTGDFLGGFGGGQANARRGRDHANAIGFPSSRPIYMAIDRDIVSAGDFDTVLSYLDGAASVLGRDQVGVYGEHDVIRRALEGGHARYGWQTAAWSGGRHYPGAHLYQRIGTVYVGGVACDINDILAADWGQHNYAAVAEERVNPMLIQGSPAKFNTQAMASGGLKTNLDATTAGADPVKFPRLIVSDAVWDALEKRTDLVDGLPNQVATLAADVAEIKEMLTRLTGQGVTLQAAGQILISPIQALP